MTDTPRAYTLLIPLPVWGMNLERTEHWRTRAARTKEFRRAAMLIARQARIPPLDRIAAEITPFGRRLVSDVCFGIAPAAKAALDGLVDAGVIPDDTARHLPRLTFHAIRKGEPGLFLLVIDLADLAPDHGSYQAKLSLA